MWIGGCKRSHDMATEEGDTHPTVIHLCVGVDDQMCNLFHFSALELNSNKQNGKETSVLANQPIEWRDTC